MPKFLALCILIVATGCSTLIKPTRPSTPLQAGPTSAGFSFAGENVSVRQPGLPLTDTRAWRTEVENYTAEKLNLLLGTDPISPLADTTASFTLAGRSAIQIGSWKEMTITLSTRLPDGRLVRSTPVSGNIDSVLEAVAGTGTEIAGYALDTTASISTFIWFFTRNDLACYAAVGSLAGGLCLNISQPGIESLIAASEERRWSDLFSTALIAHADDIRKTLSGEREAPRVERPRVNPKKIAPIKRPVISAPPKNAPAEEAPAEAAPAEEAPAEGGPPALLDPDDTAAF